MKRIICLMVAAILMAFCFTGCRASLKDEKVNIVCTVFPIYDWVRNIMGEENENVSITLLVKNGTDPHSYSPTPSDIVKIYSCDMLIYVGGESDTWISEVLESQGNEDMTVIKLLDILGERVLEEESVEGMQCEDDCHDHGHDHGVENAYDEHIWLSLKNASRLSGEISKRLCEAFPENAGKYTEKADAYIEKINELDKVFANAVAEAKVKTLLFADRFPFRYLVEDYGLEYYAAFSGCSADSEASFETVTFLSRKIDELSLKKVLILENSSTALAETVISNSSGKSATILVMDSLQSITSSDIDEGITYLSVMEKNLAILKDAIS